jgi:hypothetical protein
VIEPGSAGEGTGGSEASHVLLPESAGEGAGGREACQVLVPESAGEGAGGREACQVLVPESAGEGAGGSEAGSIHCESQLAACVGNPGLTVVQNYLESVSAKSKGICRFFVSNCTVYRYCIIRRNRRTSSETGLEIEF